MSVLGRYLLIQAPGWVLGGVFLYLLHRWAGLPGWAAAALLALYVAKDFVLFPLLRRAYEPDVSTGSERLVGESGVAVEALNPEGYIRVRGELWRARLAGGSEPVEAGAKVTVVSSRAMLLEVRRS